MIEVEIRARIKDINLLKKNLQEIGAKFEKTKKLVDKIYGRPQDLDGENKLIEGALCPRIREKDGKSNVEFKEISRQGGGIEISAPLINMDFGIKFLENLGFNEAFTIAKIRDCYDYQDFEIDIDQVEQLGDFVEIEKNVANEDQIKQARQDCVELLEKLAPGAEIVDQKYGDLMQDIINKKK